MKVTVDRPVEIEIAAVRLVLPVKYGDEDIPQDFPFRKDDMWEVTVDIDTGRIRDWPEGVAHELYMKVTDGGSYYLLDSQGNVVASIEEDYVPHGVVPGEYGDYVDLDIQSDGRISNWPKKPDVEDFFPRTEQ